MKIFFIGCVEFSFKMLNRLIELDTEIIGVATREKSGGDSMDLTLLCENYKIPCKYIKDINAPENIEWIKSLNPDYIFCFGWHQIIKKELLDLCPVIGYHPTALPSNRGRHPIIWALVLGLTETASTFFFMDEGIDSGDIISQTIIPIYYTDNARTLYDRLIKAAQIQIKEFTPKLERGKISRLKQDESLSNYWRKRIKEDGLIDWRMSAESIYNLVRALSEPYCGAHFIYKGKEIKVWKTEGIEYSNIENMEFGKVAASNDYYFSVKCGDGFIRVLKSDLIDNLKEGEYL